MYTPNHYKNEDLKQVRDFIKSNSFGILVNQVDGKPWATHIPIELNTDEVGKDILVSHISKANPQWKSFNEQEEVLCIFNGPHTYVSSSWYKDEEVPTWNYIAVHVYGKITILSEEEVLASMHKLVDKYERDSKESISLHDMSDKTMAQIRGVVGFKIEITDIQATYKLSQGREQDHAKIISELKERDAGAKAIATKMEEK
ncbi:FMN-binding negative transcriptional regulator [Maribacter sp. PR1]|uniref:FMN-binding negative transcriptional regulator n=1 Tax=Maribacter cobaltidurans TaxID=1178778 RepID=A0ABU7IVW8_9FLAO|nr:MULTISPECIES: FMN-binding negative transcriptional regulator [Maribacter]MDC6389370.1 FMN-binding negative transcriptional regulator [Maribacter sp. PR1]MEE1976758.1 FMN-binding negative transcriptional regulator [Maribacter cobaltidurans]